MPSGLDVIKRSFRLIGAIAAGETPTADMAQDALVTLQDLQDEWQLDPLTMIATVQEFYSVVANQAEYTIGNGAEFDRDFTPLDIEAASLLLASAPTPTEIPLVIYTEQQWQAIQNKELTNTLYTGLRYDRETDTGLGVVTLWPVPTTAVNDLVLYLQTPVPRFPDLATDVILAQGYKNTCVFNLCIDLIPEYGNQGGLSTEIIQKRAVEALARVKRGNLQPVELSTDPALWPMSRTTYNIQTDGGG